MIYMVGNFKANESKLKSDYLEACKYNNDECIESILLNAKDDVEMIVERYRTFIKNEQNIQTRENVLISGLNDLWMSAERLDTAGVVSLLFRMYNPLLDSSQARFVD